MAIGETDQFEIARLVASDYDGTQFLTDEVSPDGIDVNAAYAMAIDQVLGPGQADYYKRQGGHLSRTPAEIVESLISSSDGELLEQIHELRTSGLTPSEVLDQITDWPRSPITQGLIYIAPENLRSVTEVLVEAKLRILIGQIGRRLDGGLYWPRPVPGFLKFSASLEQARQDGMLVNTAVISAGHAEFIGRTYEMYGVPEPDLMITDETVQAVSHHYPVERRAKPAPLPMALAKQAWFRHHDQPVSLLRDPIVIKQIGSRIIYIGDDRVKDEGLARATHVDFVFMDKAAPEASWAQLSDRLGLLSVTAEAT